MADVGNPARLIDISDADTILRVTVLFAVFGSLSAPELTITLAGP